MSTSETITKTDLKNILEAAGNIGSVDSTAIPTASKVSEFDAAAQMNSTDMTSSEVTSFVEDLNIEGGGSGTSTPTANTAAKFDTNAHMNSADMSAQDVDNFVDDLAYTSSVADVIANMADYVIEKGTDNNWHYKKYNGGDFDAWISFESNVACDTASGSLYKSADQTLDLPSFILTDALNSWVINGSINGFEAIWFLTFATADRYVRYNIVRTTSRAAASRSVKITLQGRWK